MNYKVNSYNKYERKDSRLRRRHTPDAKPVAAAAAPAPVATHHPSPVTRHPAPRLRQQWPFLDEPDCPVELHALVGHRISQYNLYVKLYAELRQCETLTETADVCRRLLDAYLDNQLCTRELDHYRQHRRVLGRHPLISHFAQIGSLRAKTTKELYRERERTLDNIWRATNEIKKGTKPHLDGERRKRIEAYRLKLLEINNLLGE